MPFKSLAQMRLFWAKEKDGELPKGTARKWLRHTKRPISSLPERLKKAFLDIAPMFQPMGVTALGGPTPPTLSDDENVSRGPNTGLTNQPKAIAGMEFLSSTSKPGSGFDSTSISPTKGKLLKPASGSLTKMPNLEKSGGDLIAGVMKPDQSPLNMDVPKTSTPASTPALSPSDLGSDPLFAPKPPPTNTVSATGAPAPKPPLVDFDKLQTKTLDPDMASGADLDRSLRSIVNPLAPSVSPDTPPMAFKDGRPVPPEVLEKYTNPASKGSPYAGWFSPSAPRGTPSSNPWDDHQLSPAGQAAAKQWAASDKLFAAMPPEQQLARMWARPREQFEHDLTNGYAEDMNPVEQYRRVTQPFNAQSQNGIHTALPSQGLQSDNMSLSIPASMGAGLLMNAGRAGAAELGGAAAARGAATGTAESAMANAGRTALTNAAEATIPTVGRAAAGAAPAAGATAATAAAPTGTSLLRSVAGGLVDPLGSLTRGAYALPGLAGRVAGPATAAGTFLPRALTGSGAVGNAIRGTGASPWAWGAAGLGATAVNGDLQTGKSFGIPYTALSSAHALATNPDTSLSHVLSEGINSQLIQPNMKTLNSVGKDLAPLAPIAETAWNNRDAIPGLIGKFNTNPGAAVGALTGPVSQVGGQVADKAMTRIGERANAVMDPIRGNSLQLQNGGQLLPTDTASTIGRASRLAADAPPPAPAAPAQRAPDFEQQYNAAAASGDTATLSKLRDQQAQLAKTNPEQAKLDMISSLSSRDFPVSNDPETQKLYEQAKTDPAAQKALQEKHEADFAAKIDGPEAAVAGPGMAAVQGPYAKYREATASYNATQAQISQAKAENRPVPQELMDQAQQQKQRMADLRWQVQGRAAQHYDREVVQPTLKQVDAIEPQIQAFKAKAAVGPLGPEDLQQMEALKSQSSDAVNKVSRSALLRAQIDARDTSPDLDKLKTVAGFQKELSAREPVLDQNGKPVMTTMTDPKTGQTQQVPMTRPSTVLGQRVESAVMAKIHAEAAAKGGSADPDQLRAAAGSLDDTSKMLLYGGMGLAAVAALGGLLGFGGGAMSILGLLGAGAAGYGLFRNESLQNNPMQLFEGGFWKKLFGGGGSAATPTGGQKAPDAPDISPAAMGGAAVAGLNQPKPPAPFPAAGALGGAAMAGSGLIGAKATPTGGQQTPGTQGGTTPVDPAAGMATAGQYFGIDQGAMNRLQNGSAGNGDKLNVLAAFKDKLDDPGLPQVIQQIPASVRQQVADGIDQAGLFDRGMMNARGIDEAKRDKMLEVLKATGITPRRPS